MDHFRKSSATLGEKDAVEVLRDGRKKEKRIKRKRNRERNRNRETKGQKARERHSENWIKARRDGERQTDLLRENRTARNHPIHFSASPPLHP